MKFLSGWDHELIKKMTSTCHQEMDKSFSGLIARKEARRQRSAASAELTRTMIRTLFPENKGAAVPPKDVQQVLDNMDFTLKPMFPSRAKRPVRLSDLAPTIDVTGPPYLNEVWRAFNSTGNASTRATADAPFATFGFTVGASGGTAFAGAGLVIPVASASPFEWQIQIRPFCPFSYQYHDVSNFWVAHSDMSFGIKVFSFDINGQDGRVEQDFEYPVWMDGTSWQEEHTNPSFSDFDFDNAFEFDHTMPFFTAPANRNFLATVFCWGSCDADSGDGFASSALAAANVTMPYVAIAKQ